MSLKITPPQQIYYDKDGTPLDAGFIYIGQVSQNPETNQVAVYWDSALTLPAPQPIRTLNGYPSRQGVIANIYTASSFSITVKSKRKELVFTSSFGNSSVSNYALLVFPDYAAASAAAATLPDGQFLDAMDEQKRYRVEAGALVFVENLDQLRIDLADPSKGAAIVATKLPLPGAADRTQEDKNLDRVSILDFGGVGDGITLNVLALRNAKAALGGAGVIHFPITGGTSYLFDASQSTDDTDGMTLDVDEGVTLTLLDLGYLSPNCKVVRDTRCYFTYLSREYWLAPGAKTQWASRPLWLSRGDADAATIMPIYPNGANLEYKYVAWPNGDVFTPFVPTGKSVSGCVLAAPNNSTMRSAMYACSPGEEISAQFNSAVGTALILAMVKTDGGYCGVFGDTTDTPTATYFSKRNGEQGVSSQFTYFGQGNHSSYSLYKSVWTIRVNSAKSFSILLNGYEVLRKDLPDNIAEVGFGAYGQAASSSVVVQDWVVQRNKAQGGRGPTNVAVFGDSISDPTLYGNWPSYMKECLDFFSGMRVHRVDNYAVSGENSTQQAARCTPGAIAAADVVLIMVGVNDIQSNTSDAAYAANLTQMINTCLSAGKKVIVGCPTMFYGQGQAGASGQNATNYDVGRFIRAKCMRVCADLGVKFVDTLQQTGPTLAQYVNPGFPDAFTSYGVDPMLYDNIHPSLMGRMLLGKIFAQAVAGLYFSDVDVRTPRAVLTGFANGWLSGGEPLVASKDSEGVVSLEGYANAGTKTDGTVICILPTSLRPLQTVRVIAFADSTYCHVNIDAGTGSIIVYKFGAQNYLSLDGISYPTRRY